jgi:hypothetical protein
MTNKENTVNNAMEYADYSIGKFFWNGKKKKKPIIIKTQFLLS